MKRFHVHVGVKDLEESIRFYSSLFGAEPVVRQPDYAKWMIDDPRINFAISRRSSRFGVNHLGLQVDESDELSEVKERFAAADNASIVDEDNVTCCYATSNKRWVTDPQGIAWEGWQSLGQVEVYGDDREADTTGRQTAGGCCSPADATAALPATTCCAPANASAALSMTTKSGCCA